MTSLDAKRSPPVAPSRARGLKHGSITSNSGKLIVAPSRARGLKLLRSQRCGHVLQVAPSRARGLKRGYISRNFYYSSRRALTGAWIETPPAHLAFSWQIKVAPSRARGLKLKALR